MSFKINALYLTDGYKVGHKAMLAVGTVKLYGTWIPRSLKHAPKGITKILSFGQQLTVKWIHDAFVENFFYSKETEEHRKTNNVVGLAVYKNEAMVFAKDICMYLGMDFNGDHFGELWDLGYLPIRMKALPEGIETNPNIPHMTFINTVDGFAWLTLFLETIISSLAWKPSTSGTIAKQYRRNTERAINKTDKQAKPAIPFLCHDFSARGLNPHDMYVSGLGHATSFRGSDTLSVIPAARYYYNEPKDEVCINSVNASEHSVSTTKIFTVGESQMISDWLDIFTEGILSIVSDTFDLWVLITKYLAENKEKIMSRDGKLVIRPDSGNPVDIICGLNTITQYGSDEFLELKGEKESFNFQIDSVTYHFDGDVLSSLFDEYGESVNDSTQTISDLLKHGVITQLEKQPSINEYKGVVELLWDMFGGTINDEGYKVLDSHIGVIYGDSITIERQEQIYERLEAKGFAASNIVLGIGSYTYQYNTRDTFGFAAKGAWFEVINEKGERIQYNIFKDPVTDDGTKKSLKGLQKVYYDDSGEIVVKGECTMEEENEGLLQVIYEDGVLYNQTTLTEIREVINQSIEKEYENVLA